MARRAVAKNANQALPTGYEGRPRKGGWIQTFTGLPFWPLDPSPEDVTERDIAHALSNQCRFAGHCRTFYSVAEHSVRVSLALEAEGHAEDALWGLLHDAPEAYLIDMPRPLKETNGFAEPYRAAEARLMAVVCDVYELPHEMPESVQLMDVRLLQTEARDLMWPSGARLWDMGVEPLPETINPAPPSVAEGAFLARLFELTGRDPEDVFA